jgi:hypothetical protein
MEGDPTTLRKPTEGVCHRLGRSEALPVTEVVRLRDWG